MANNFVPQLSENINFTYTCFDRVIVKGYILGNLRRLIFAGQMILFMRSMGLKYVTEGLLKILTGQIRAHIEFEASKYGIPIIWWPEIVNPPQKRKRVQGKKRKRRKKRVNRKKKGIQGAKQKYVIKNYVKKCLKPVGNHVYCILTDMERAKTFKQEKNPSNKKRPYFYDSHVPVKHYYIYFQDKYLGLCYLKVNTYFPFDCEFYFNGHNGTCY